MRYRNTRGSLGELAIAWKMRNSQRSNVWAQYLQSSACSSLLNMHLNLKSARLIAVCKRTYGNLWCIGIYVKKADKHETVITSGLGGGAPWS